MLLNLVGCWLCHWGKYHQENAENGIFGRLEAPPLSASQLPRLLEKSGYGPAHGPFWRVNFLFHVSWSLCLASDSPLIQPCYQLHNALELIIDILPFTLWCISIALFVSWRVLFWNPVITLRNAYRTRNRISLSFLLCISIASYVRLNNEA